MMNKKINFLQLICLIALASIAFSQNCVQAYDVNLIGHLNDIQSISRHTSSFIDCLPQNISIKLFQSNFCSPKDLSPIHREILKNSVDLKNKPELAQKINQGLRLSGITICTEHWWNNKTWTAYKSIPDDSIIKYHYCVTERTELPKEWVSRFNNNFDALVVADEWLVDVYKNSGVHLPIFTLPLAINLNSLLSAPLKKHSAKKILRKPFVFGVSGILFPRKNHTLLMQAFHEEFKNNPYVKLVIQGRHTGADYIKKIDALMESIQNKNIKIIQKRLSRTEYEEYLRSLNAYVLISKGEGYSITPREALAAGVPTILSDNTAHRVICKNNFMYSVPSSILKPSYCYITHQYLGNDFNCTLQDVRKALRHVYENYQYYLDHRELGREWVKQYLPENLSPQYLNLVQPRKVIFGPENKITNEYLMTNSKELFEKYQKLCKEIS